MAVCKGLFVHSIGNLETIEITKTSIKKHCKKCGYIEVLPRSQRNVYFVNDRVQQTKKWAADDNAKELLQPMNQDGSINEDFTEAYGYNPYDERTKEYVPKVQGGLA